MMPMGDRSGVNDFRDFGSLSSSRPIRSVTCFCVGDSQREGSSSFASDALTLVA
jgi:hypothetical protein